jgi:SecD/SecF fusion protein
VFGTYSSIFIAAPLLILFHLRAGAASADGEKKVEEKAVAT